MVEVRYRYQEVHGHQLFYREAGPVDAPTIVLLHGFPTSSFWAPVWAYAENANPETEAAMRAPLDLDTIRWQYLHGVADPSVVSPDTWNHDFALVSRPGNDLVQLRLFRDYRNNRDLYPRLHEYLRASQVPLLAVWGRNDEIFGPDGARAFAADLPDAEIELLDGGHFLLESHLDTAAGYIRGFLGRVPERQPVGVAG